MLSIRSFDLICNQPARKGLCVQIRLKEKKEKLGKGKKRL